MIACWRIEIRYPSEGGTKKVMQSNPMTWTEARTEVQRYLNMRHDAKVIEIPEATAQHLKEIARERRNAQAESYPFARDL